MYGNEKMKKGIFFTIDSLLASGIVIVAILLVSNFYSVERQRTNVNFASQDLVRVFSTMTVGEVNNNYVQSLITSGAITNTNNTILEQIGEFWANGRTDLAANFTKNLTETIFPAAYGYSVLVNGEEIYSRSIPVQKSLVSSKQIITGIAKAKPTQGFTARVLLAGIKSKKTNAYTYFGGYEGDGNLTKKLFLPTNIISFNSSYLEVDAGGSFNLYINNVFSGSYAAGSGGGAGLLADKWNISNAYLSNFKNGENTIRINFTSGNSYIAGGFLRLTYTTSSFNDTQTFGYDKYLFPGIDGVINLYSSIYVPGPLNNMNIFLNYSSNYVTFLKLGSTTVYQENPNGTKSILISDSALSTLLDYSTLNQKTIPLRLGLGNGTTLGGNADAVLVSDVSGSMDWCAKISSETQSATQNDNAKGCFWSGSNWQWWFFNFTPNNGYSNYNRTVWYNGTDNLCGCRYHTKCTNDSRKLELYINSSLQFTDTLFSTPNNRVGLVEFSSNYGFVYKGDCSTSTPTTTPFTDGIVRINNLTYNKQQLVDTINTAQSWWGTCTCCGINKAADLLNSQNNQSRKKYVILMSDGDPTVTCAQQPNSTAIADAVQSAWDACNQNISVYTIAFGNDADTSTMQRMNCSGGKFFNTTDTTKLQQAYKDIAGEINKLSFVEQAANFTGSFSKTTLYPNSYIEFNYTPADIQFNKLPIGFETDRFGNNISTGSLAVYPNTSVSDAKVTSYSGSKWTDSLAVNGNTVYRLGDYGSNYQSLGDPFTVNIPIGSINQGNNSITISTGINSTNSTGGSSDDRVIYTLLLNGVADYSSVVSKANGCSWTVSFEDGTASTINVPSTYSGTDVCTFSTKTYDANDALNNAVYQLFSNLDFDKNGKLNVVIDQSNINVYTLTISKVPSLWGPAIIELRVWQ